MSHSYFTSDTFGVSHDTDGVSHDTVSVSHDTGGVDIPVNPFLYEMLLQRIVDRIIVSHYIHSFYYLFKTEKAHFFMVLFTLYTMRPLNFHNKLFLVLHMTFIGY